MTLAVPPARKQSTLPPLEPGDHLDQPTFHARYEAMPSRIRAELIGGKVFMPSPLRAEHGSGHALIMLWLGLYSSSTTQTEVFDNATDILGRDSEPQPDAMIIVKGGRTQLTDAGYLKGPPELIVEVASSSESYDLFDKREDYEKYGVGEYLVLLLREHRAVWFVREQGSFVEMREEAGVLRSRLFPGLWLDVNSIFRNDKTALLDVLRQGMATQEHAAFVQRLAESVKG